MFLSAFFHPHFPLLIRSHPVRVYDTPPIRQEVIGVRSHSQCLPHLNLFRFLCYLKRVKLILKFREDIEILFLTYSYSLKDRLLPIFCGL